MDVVFVQTFVPDALKPAFQRRCSVMAQESGTHFVLLRCLNELLHLAAETGQVPPTALYDACNACTDAVAFGLDPSAPTLRRKASLGVISRAASWHFNAEPVVAWLSKLLKDHALTRDDGQRMDLELAQKFCEMALRLQTVVRRDNDCDELGELLLKLVGAGSRGKKTLRLLWHRRGSKLEYTLEYRAWRFLSGLADVFAEDPVVTVALKFDSDLWTCLAAERLDEHKQNLQERLLAQFRAAKRTTLPNGKTSIGCGPYICMASMAIDAAFSYEFGSNPLLLQCVKLFVNSEHVAFGCKSSSWALFDNDMWGSSQPEWGCSGQSSSLSMTARWCRQISVRGRPDAAVLCDQVLDTIAPLFKKAVGKLLCPRRRDGLFQGMTRRGSNRALAFLAAAPFSSNTNAPWRQMLLEALDKRIGLWRAAASVLPMSGERIMSQRAMWADGTPLLRLFEAASRAHSFTPDEAYELNSLRCQAYAFIDSPDKGLLWAATTALAVLCIGSFETVLPWLAACCINAVPDDELNFPTPRPSTASAAMECLEALEVMLAHPDRTRLLFNGKFRGSWRPEPLPELVTAKGFTADTAIEVLATHRSLPNCLELARREAGLYTPSPAAKSDAWWHLGPAFAKAALAFLGCLAKRKLAPPEIGHLILIIAAVVRR